jgi:hypothetical protein
MAIFITTAVRTSDPTNLICQSVRGTKQEQNNTEEEWKKAPPLPPAPTQQLLLCNLDVRARLVVQYVRL